MLAKIKHFAENANNNCRKFKKHGYFNVFKLLTLSI